MSYYTKIFETLIYSIILLILFIFDVIGQAILF